MIAKKFNSLLLANKRLNCKNCFDHNVNLNLSLHHYIANVNGNEVSENCVREKNRKCGKCLKAIARNLNPICCNIREKVSKCVADSLPFTDLEEKETYRKFNVSRISDSNWINKPTFTIQSLLDQMPGQKFEL